MLQVISITSIPTCYVLWLQDVVYFFQPQEDCLVTVATCNSAQFVDNFDTVLYVLSNVMGPGDMEVVGCNDDACSYFSQLQVSAFTRAHENNIYVRFVTVKTSSVLAAMQTRRGSGASRYST